MKKSNEEIKYEIPCKTPEEFWEKLSPLKLINNKNIIYRGQKNATWNLIPGVLRSRYSSLKTSADQIFFEKAILHQFAEQCDQIGLRIPNDSIEFRKLLHPQSIHSEEYYMSPSKWPDKQLLELMALAQHHGLPTQLLDWSKRSYIAAYFAASSALANPEPNTKISVWALDLSKLEQCNNIQIVKVPGSTSSNLSAQFGLFTVLQHRVHRSEPYPFSALENEFDSWKEAPIQNITLPEKHARIILRYCDLHGVSASTLFPDYSGAVKSVKDWINLMCF